jgi:hypothetical protein
VGDTGGHKIFQATSGKSAAPLWYQVVNVVAEARSHDNSDSYPYTGVDIYDHRHLGRGQAGNCTSVGKMYYSLILL